MDHHSQPTKGPSALRRIGPALAWVGILAGLAIVLAVAIRTLTPIPSPLPAAVTTPTSAQPTPAAPIATPPATETSEPTQALQPIPSETPAPTPTEDSLSTMPLPESLDLANATNQATIADYLARNLSFARDGAQVFCAFRPLTGPVKSANDSQAFLYVWAVCDEYSQNPQGLQKGSGISSPVAITLTRGKDGYQFAELSTPRGGTGFAPDVKAIFPADTWEQILPSTPKSQEDYNARAQALEDAARAQAEQALGPIGAAPTQPADAGNSGSSTEIAVRSPNGRWTAVYSPERGGLALEDASGAKQTLFPSGQFVNSAIWSAASDRLAVSISQPVSDATPGRVDEIWMGMVSGDTFGKMSRIYTPADATEATKGMGEQIVLGTWSPNGGLLTFWQGMMSASIQADGLPLFVLDAKRQKAWQAASTTLTNRFYQAWAPDSSALVFTNGGDRRALVHKWLSKFDVASGQTSDIVPEAQYVPGDVAWSPDGKTVAFAAVAADQTGEDKADFFGWENPAIQARRIYLYDVTSGKVHALNQAQAYQDAPRWVNARLAYVQMDQDQAQVMLADPQTGETTPAQGCWAPLPPAAGDHGQTDWSGLMDGCKLGG